jgi:hypothetical protein
MDTLTKYDALLGELEPYTPSSLTIRKALADAGITDLAGEYAPETDKRSIALAAIKVLKKMIVLTSDSLGKSSQGYSAENLEKRIQELCAENGLEASEFVRVSSVSDGSNMW